MPNPNEPTLRQHSLNEMRKADVKRIEVVLNYEEGTAELPPMGALELMMLYRAVNRATIQRTGMEPERFLAGMAELLAPVEQ